MQVLITGRASFIGSNSGRTGKARRPFLDRQSNASFSQKRVLLAEAIKLAARQGWCKR